MGKILGRYPCNRSIHPCAHNSYIGLFPYADDLVPGIDYFAIEDRNFAAGFGMKLGLGFTEYAVDYTFRPLPDYGFVHSFGVAISF